LIVLGGLFLFFGFIGFNFGEMDNEPQAHETDEDQQAATPIDLPNPLSSDAQNRNSNRGGKEK
jgi:hypothetical protein